MIGQWSEIGSVVVLSVTATAVDQSVIKGHKIIAFSIDNTKNKNPKHKKKVLKSRVNNN